MVEGSTGSAGVLTRSDFPPSIATRELRRCSHLQLKSSGRVVELGERLPGCRCCSRRRSISHMFAQAKTPEIGRASCRERVCQYVSIQVVAGSLKKHKDIRI